MCSRLFVLSHVRDYSTTDGLLDEAVWFVCGRVPRWPFALVIVTTFSDSAAALARS
jgi:hypothetical protein